MEAPTLLAHQDCSWYYDCRLDALHQQPRGFRSGRRPRIGAALLVDTSTVTPGVALQAGFLRTHASRAVARLSCIAPCRCVPTELHAFTNASTSTTEYSPVHPFHAEASCAFELRLVSDGETFKFVGLQVLV